MVRQTDLKIGGKQRYVLRRRNLARPLGGRARYPVALNGTPYLLMPRWREAVGKSSGYPGYFYLYFKENRTLKGFQIRGDVIDLYFIKFLPSSVWQTH